MVLNQLFHKFTYGLASTSLQGRILSSKKMMASSFSTASPKQFSTNEEMIVQHDAKNQKFVLHLDVDHSAFIKYEALSTDEVLLYHTEVPKSYGGKGIGKILAEEAFKHFDDNGQKMVITCTYLQKLQQDRQTNPN